MTEQEKKFLKENIVSAIIEMQDKFESGIGVEINPKSLAARVAYEDQTETNTIWYHWDDLITNPIIGHPKPSMIKVEEIVRYVELNRTQSIDASHS